MNVLSYVHSVVAQSDQEERRSGGSHTRCELIGKDHGRVHARSDGHRMPTGMPLFLNLLNLVSMVFHVRKQTCRENEKLSEACLQNKWLFQRLLKRSVHAIYISSLLIFYDINGITIY